MLMQPGTTAPRRSTRVKKVRAREVANKKYDIEAFKLKGFHRLSELEQEHPQNIISREEDLAAAEDTSVFQAGKKGRARGKKRPVRVFEEVLQQDLDSHGKRKFVDVDTAPSKIPARHQCVVCLLPSNYVCTKTGERYCSNDCHQQLLAQKGLQPEV